MLILGITYTTQGIHAFAWTLVVLWWLDEFPYVLRIVSITCVYSLVVAHTSSSVNRADSRLGPGQWETSLQSNAVSHWLGANLESALVMIERVHIKASIHWAVLDVLPPNLVKTRSSEIGCFDNRIALKFGRYLGNHAAEVHVKF